MPKETENAAAAAAAALEGTDAGADIEAADQRALTRQKPPLRTPGLLQLMEFGEVVARSGSFSDMNSTAKAVVKLKIGEELGLSMTASLTGIYIFQTSEGTRVIIAGQLLLAKINADQRYRLEIIISNRTTCMLMPWKKGGLFENGEEFQRVAPQCVAQGCSAGKVKGGDRCPECVGLGYVPVKFTIDDAKTLGLLEKKNWRGDPESMLLWRCVAKAQRRYFPDLLAIGQAYLDDELDEVRIPAAIGVMEAGEKPEPQITVMRPRRTSQAPPEAVDGQLASDQTPPDPGPLEPESFGGEDFPLDPPAATPPPEPEPAAAAKAATGHKKCARHPLQEPFTGLFCPSCMKEPV